MQLFKIWGFIKQYKKNFAVVAHGYHKTHTVSLLL